MIIDKCPKCQSTKIVNCQEQLLYCLDCTWYRRIWKKADASEHSLREWRTFCCRGVYLMKITLSKGTGCYFVNLYGYYTKGTREIPDEMKAFTTEDDANNFVEILKKKLQDKPHVKYVEMESESWCWVSIEDPWLTKMFTSHHGHPRAYT